MDGFLEERRPRGRRHKVSIPQAILRGVKRQRRAEILLVPRRADPPTTVVANQIYRIVGQGRGHASLLNAYGGSLSGGYLKEVERRIRDLNDFIRRLNTRRWISEEIIQ